MRTLILLFTLLGGMVGAAEPSIRWLDTLKPGHPRLGLDTGRIERVRALVRDDAVAKKVYADRLKRARGMLDDPVSTYEIPDGKRLLTVSRRVLDRVSTLAFARWMENDPAFAARAWKELEAAAAFPDWNPSHFLDTAEMTRAFGIGYDWLYADWTPEQRGVLEQAILQKGLRPGLEGSEKKRWWGTCDHNWNHVCNGGLGIGALAIADVAPVESEAIITAAIRNLPIATRAFGPDGAGLEGPTYWSYGCNFLVSFIDALDSALGTEAGLADPPELALSGGYHLYQSGATPRRAFDFSDCGSVEVSDTAHFWLARRFREPAYAWLRYQGLDQRPSTADVWDLLWFDVSGRDFDVRSLPLDRHYRRAECVSMRSSWTNRDATVLGIKGGDNTFNHWHLDLGSFILEADGVRWIIDSGVEKQSYHTHSNRQSRWSFYRIRAEGHNTLVLNPSASTNGPDQRLKGRAPVTAFTSGVDYARAELDLTSAYSDHAQSVRRTFDLMDGRRTVVVTDRVVAETPVDLWWFAHTEAEVEVAANGRSAILRQKDRMLRVEVAGSDPKAQLGVMPARPLPGSPDPVVQNPNTGRRKLFIHRPDTSDLTLAVRFIPVARK